jgi:hypothetical protein
VFSSVSYTSVPPSEKQSTTTLKTKEQTILEEKIGSLTANFTSNFRKYFQNIMSGNFGNTQSIDIFGERKECGQCQTNHFNSPTRINQ